MSRSDFDGRRRAVLEGLQPSIDGGRFPVKRVLGEQVTVETSAFTDGHDQLRVVLQYKHDSDQDWSEVEMIPLYNDRWQATFAVTQLGRYRYGVVAWVDAFESWHHELARRVQAEDIAVALLTGAELVQDASKRAKGAARKQLADWAARLANRDTDIHERKALALSEALIGVMSRYPDRTLATTYDTQHEVVVDPERARFSAWYELFPRSCAVEGGHHGTFRDCISRLGEVAAMGFDVLYFPPIHPIGTSNRKGRNNTLIAEPDDTGSPWAIGNEDGGHKAIHPELGTLEDFRELVDQARGLGIEVAMDIAFQCSPDHPYVEQHPEWFRWRADGRVQYAENPPKKYQDIYPLNFDSSDWQALWQELKSIFCYWIENGVRIFRVDNPHTKPFPFWEWVINEIKREHPEVIFLAEAFSRPKVMYRLAKGGFTQSYTYFTWRNTKWELTQYLTELTKSEVREYFRPNFWPNTPDILHAYLQFGGRAAFMTRAVLAATLTSNYGIYGPAFELLEAEPREPGSEEYRDSEKYQIRHWQTDRADSLRGLLTRLNHVRRDNSALQQDWNLEFYPVDNDEIICYGKWSEDESNTVIVLVNLDPYHKQSGWVTLPAEALGIDVGHPYQMHDLLTGARYLWNGGRNYIELGPDTGQAHIFRLLRHVRTEHDFEYFF